jgi:hypothetical protein
MKEKQIKPKNIMAQDLRTPKYKSRVVKSKKEYSRKNKIDKVYDYVILL